MSARPVPAAPAFAPMAIVDLDRVLAIENLGYEFPWTRGNFVDSLAAGYRAQLLLAGPAAVDLAGYTVALCGAGELHLLNLTVAPRWQRHGFARRLLDELVAFARANALGQIWLEVREANERAREVYRRYGFATIGRRRGYYPARAGQREDAIVMGLSLDALD